MEEARERLIRQKLANIASYIEELAPYLDEPLSDYLAQPGRRRIVERLAQIIIESAIDTNNLLIVSLGGMAIPTARQSFEAVHRLQIIDDYLLTRFRRTYIGFRNRIVHDYDVLDSRIVYATVRRLLGDARKYVETVYSYLALAKVERQSPGTRKSGTISAN